MCHKASSELPITEHSNEEMNNAVATQGLGANRISPARDSTRSNSLIDEPEFKYSWVHTVDEPSSQITSINKDTTVNVFRERISCSVAS